MGPPWGSSEHGSAYSRRSCPCPSRRRYRRRRRCCCCRYHRRRCCTSVHVVTRNQNKRVGPAAVCPCRPNTRLYVTTILASAYRQWRANDNRTVAETRTNTVELNERTALCYRVAAWHDKSGKIDGDVSARVVVIGDGGGVLSPLVRGGRTE